MNILEGVLLSAKDEGLQVSASNLEQSIVVGGDADIEQTGEVVIPADKLRKLVNDLPAGMLEVKEINDKVTVVSDGSSYTLQTYRSEEFPELPEIEEGQMLSIGGEVFADIIDKVAVCAAAEGNKPGLEGVMINKGDFVATNTFRLALYESDNENDAEMLIPADALQNIKRVIAGDEILNIIYDDSHVIFEQDDRVIYSRLISGKFPNYKQVIPQDYQAKLSVNRQDLLAAAKRAGYMSDIIKMTCTPDMTVIESNAQDGSGEENIDTIHHEGEGNMSIKLDAGYLQDALKSLDKNEVNIEINGDTQPLTLTDIRDDKYRHIIMPIRPEVD